MLFQADLRSQDKKASDQLYLPDDFSLNLETLELHGTKILIIDPETGTILKANLSAKKFYGYDPVVGRNINEINVYSPEKVAEEMQNALEQNRNFFNFRHRLKNGKIRSVKVYSYPFDFRDKKLLLSIIHDVTNEERRDQMMLNVFMVLISTFLILIIFYLMRNIIKRNKVETNLKVIQESLENAQEIGKIGSWEYDIANRKSIWSKNFHQMLGFKVGSITPSHSLFLQSIYPDDLRLMKQAEEELKRTRKQLDLELRYLASGKQVKWCRMYMVPHVQNNEVRIIKGVSIDITDIKEYELKFKSQMDYLEFALNVSRNFINIVSDDFIGLMRNVLNGICEKFGLDRVSFVKNASQEDELEINEVVVRSGADPLSQRMIGCILDELPDLKKKMETGNYYYSKNEDDFPESHQAEREEFAKRGTKSFLGVPVRYQSELLGIIAMESVAKESAFDKDKMLAIRLIAELFANVLVRRRIYMNLIRTREISDMANQAKSIFLSNMSHELRTPLNGVIGFTDLLLDTKLEPIQKDYLKNVSLSARTLLEILSNILDLSKIESGKFELENSITDIHSLVKDSVNILQYSLKSKGLSSEVKIESNVPRIVSVDSSRLRQVLVNLLSNSIKFTQKGNVKVELSFEKKDSNFGIFHFSVSDTGIGISHSQKYKIFHAFSQADYSITRKFGGSGLGLVISNSILKMAGSQLEFESELGKGSKFYFSLEMEFFEESEFSQEDYEMSLDDSTLSLFDSSLKTKQARILLVEDVELNMVLVQKMIRKIIPEAQLLEAINGKEALEIFRNQELDLIFMDVQMPVMDGLTATEKIRELEKENPLKTNIPIIGLTAGASRDEVNRSLKYGMDDCLTKPIDKDELIAILEKYLMIKV